MDEILEVSINASVLTLIEDEGTETTLTLTLSAPPPEGGIDIDIQTGKEFGLGDFLLLPPDASFTGIGGFQGFNDNSGVTLTIIAQAATITFPIFDDDDRSASDPNATRNDDIGEEQTTFSIAPGNGYSVSSTAGSVTLTLLDTASSPTPTPDPTPTPGPTPIPGPTPTPGPPPTPGAPSEPAPPFQGTAGRDRIQGTNASDEISGLGGRDTLSGLGGRDVISGGAGRDNLSGGAGKDTLLGDGGKDRLRGGAGRDTLYGGAGSDIVIGNGGRDIFVLEQRPGRDTFRDFRDRRDRLGLSNGLEFDDLTFTDQGRNVLIQVGNRTLAIVLGVNADQLTQADFVDV